MFIENKNILYRLECLPNVRRLRLHDNSHQFNKNNEQRKKEKKLPSFCDESAASIWSGLMYNVHEIIAIRVIHTVWRCVSHSVINLIR